MLQALFAYESVVNRAKPNTAQFAILETLGEALDVAQAQVRAVQATLARKARKQPAAKRTAAKS